MRKDILCSGHKKHIGPGEIHTWLTPLRKARTETEDGAFATGINETNEEMVWGFGNHTKETGLRGSAKTTAGVVARVGLSKERPCTNSSNLHMVIQLVLKNWAQNKARAFNLYIPNNQQSLKTQLWHIKQGYMLPKTHPTVHQHGTG